MPELWEVLEVSDELCKKVVSKCDELYEIQDPDSYLMSDGEIKLCVDYVMFNVSGFYDGYYLFARFLPEDGLDAVRRAVVGFAPHHPRYAEGRAHCEAKWKAKRQEQGQ